MKKRPATRQCVGCRGTFEKNSLIRVIRTPEGEITIDRTGRANGRGAYLCDNISCLKKARKTHSLERSLKTDIPDDIYDELERSLESG